MIKKNIHTKDLLRYKDAIVILGATGAGKSTCVQMILGYKLTLLKRDNKLSTLIPVGGLKK